MKQCLDYFETVYNAIYPIWGKAKAASSGWGINYVIDKAFHS
jgi:hypothetical protein